MDARIVAKNENFCYDPLVSGFDGLFWSTEAPFASPTLNAGKLEYNAAKTNSYTWYKYGNFTFYATIPTIPTFGDVRYIGLTVPSLFNATSYCGFAITNDKLFAKSVDEFGNVASTEIAWDAAWTAVETAFQIHISSTGVLYRINGVIVARHNCGSDGTNQINFIDKNPNCLTVLNENADVLKLGLVICRGIESLT